MVWPQTEALAVRCDTEALAPRYFGLQAAPAGQALEGNASQAGTSAAAASEPAASSQAQRAQQAVSMEEEEEWRGLVCMVCKEGYASQPTELLAAYCYCMKLRSGEGFGAVPEVWMGPGAPARSDGLQVIPETASHACTHGHTRAKTQTCTLCHPFEDLRLYKPDVPRYESTAVLFASPDLLG